MALTAPKQGTVIADRYHLDSIVGEGGMARIWRAHDDVLDRTVAVKILFMREDRDLRKMVSRFMREARIAAAVRHPNVIDTLDFGTESDRPYLVMEYLEGESLDHRISRDPSLTLSELIELTAGVLDGLAAVHEAGIVHRDLKPENIFLASSLDGVRAKVLDFGVSRDLDPRASRRSAMTTQDGFLIGTPQYMSPEQARGLRDIDHQSDIYNVGAILYEALTGQLPFDDEAVGDLLVSIISGGPPPVVELNPAIGAPISEVVEKAMRVERADRYRSAQAMRRALLAAADVEIPGAGRPSLPMPAPDRLVELEVETLAAEGPSSVEASHPIPLADDQVSGIAAIVPTRRSRSRPWVWIAGAGLLAGVGAIAGMQLSIDEPRPAPRMEIPHRRPVAEPEPIVDSPPPAPPATEPAAELPPEPITVTLAGLPAAAEVRVDGRVTETPEGTVELLGDGRAHMIVVRAPGRRTFEAELTADADQSLAIDMPPRARRRRSRPESTAERHDDPHDGVFRELDF